MAYKLLAIIILFIVGIVLLSTSMMKNENGVTPLGIFGGNKPIAPCSGELSTSTGNLGNGKCHLEAKSVLKNCEGKKWYVIEGNSCNGGILVCQGNINEPNSIWTCSWDDSNFGSRTFTLCADTDALITTSAYC